MTANATDRVSRPSPRGAKRCAGLVLGAVLAASAGCGPTLTPGNGECSPDSSVVFVDDNRNGRLDEGEPPLPGAVVFFETELMAVADRCGTFAIVPTERDGLLWVRGQDGLEPGPYWLRLAGGLAPRLEIPVRRAAANGALSFAVASDTHAGIDAMGTKDQLLGLVQAAGISPRPHFIAVTGDLTQENRPDQFESLLTAIRAIDVPYVPVPGNHDWYDGGAAYRSYFGPPSYSFDAGGVHFVVLNDAVTVSERLAFLDLDRKLVTDDRPIVLLTHAPPREPLRLALEERDIDLLLTGHLHTNRVLLHDTFVEYNTQPLVMGGMDLSPAGFRVFRRAGDGGFEVSHHTIVNRGVLAIVAPGLGQVFAPCTAEIIVAVEPGVAVPEVTAEVEGVGEVALRPVGGWDYRSPVLNSLCAPGSYAVSVSMALPDGSLQRASASLVIGARPHAPAGGEWPMLQGDARHTGAQPEVFGYPLRTQWVSTVGGHLHGGSPVVAGGRVFLAVSDFGSGERGGIVALDLRDGHTLWEHRVGFSVRNAAAVAGDVVIFVSNDGTVHGVDAATGEGRWTYELARRAPTVERSLYSSPTVVGGIAYVGGRQEFIAIEAASGELLWRVEPLVDEGELSSHSSAAVDGNSVVIPFNRFDGLFAFDRATGIEMWRTGPSIVQAAQGSPVLHGQMVFVVNELMRLSAISVRQGREVWHLFLEEGGFEWGVLSASTPVLQGSTLLVGTQLGRLHAVDTVNIDVRWTYEAEPSLIRATHYRGESAAITASPVVTGDVVWLPGQDGVLRALDLVTGDSRWSMSLGVPMSSSPAVAGELLIVSSYDGSVRALCRVRADAVLTP